MESVVNGEQVLRVLLAELLRCLERPLSEEQAWALCFQGCRTMGQLAQGLPPALHAVLIKGPGSIFIHADGDVSFKVHQKSADVGNAQQLEEKLLEYLGVAVYEALDWGIDSQVERELSEPLEKLLSLMLKLDNEAVKRVVTLQDVIKICEDRLPRPSEAASHYKGICRSLFAEYIELQKLLSIIQTSKEVNIGTLKWAGGEVLEKHKIIIASYAPYLETEEDGHGTLAGESLSEEGKIFALWPAVVRELRSGVRLRAAPRRPRAPAPERARSPHEALADDIRQRRYSLRKVIIEEKCKGSRTDATSPMPRLKPVLERKLNQQPPPEPGCREQLLAEIKRLRRLRLPVPKGNGSGPGEMPLAPDTALKSPSNSILTLQSLSTEVNILNAVPQQLGPGVREAAAPLASSVLPASARCSARASPSTGLSADCTCAPISGPILGITKPVCSLNSGQQELPPYRRRSRSLESALQSKELDRPVPTKWPLPTIAELIGTRYAMVMLEEEGSPRRCGDGVFPRARICFSCHKQMFLKWPYSCYLCSSVVCCDCCVKMSMPFRMCVHLPLGFLKLLRLSKGEDPSTQHQKSSDLLRELEHWKCPSVPVVLEPHSLVQSLHLYTRTRAAWQSVDICTRCEQYLLNVASAPQPSTSLGRMSRSWTKLE